MPRLTIAAQTLPGAYPVLPLGAGSVTLTLTGTTDQTDRETPLVDAKTVVVAYNSDTGAHTVTFTSAADSYNRTGDITAYSLAAKDIAMFGPFRSAGWATDGKLQIDVSDAKVQLAVMTLP